MILQFGGQTSLNLASRLAARSIKILGTQNKYIDLAEDREKFANLLDLLDIDTPKGCAVRTREEAFEAVERLGYPLVVRPSFVIGGRAMQVVYSDEELVKYLKEAVKLSHEHPVLIDKYVEGKEIEVDAVADGEDVLIPGIMEHIERTGVHSGDSCTVYPAYSLPEEVIEQLASATKRICRALHVVGLVNIQYAWDGRKIYVIEVNPRASRTVPILSKVTKVPMVRLAVAVMTGKKLSELGYGTGIYPAQDYYAVKIPVFSDAKLTDVDVAVGPEMKSTGEVLGIDQDLDRAIYKGFLGAGMEIPVCGDVFVSLKDHDKTAESAEIIKAYADMGFRLCASEGTAAFLQNHGIAASVVEYGDVIPLIGEQIRIVINTPKAINRVGADTFPIRRQAIEHGLPVLTCMDTAWAFAKAVRQKKDGVKLEYAAL